MKMKRQIGFHHFYSLINPFLQSFFTDTLNLIDEKVGKSLELIGTRGNYLNRTPIAQDLRSRTDKWNLMKLESFCKAKDIINRTNQHRSPFILTI